MSSGDALHITMAIAKAELADRIATMYAGKIVEIGSADDIFYRRDITRTLGLIRARAQSDRRV